MNETIRALLSISKIREALQRNDLDFVYDQIATNSERSDLTVFLLENGIDPLDYISKIWWGMYSHVNVEITELIIPDHITEIENFAFDGDTCLERIRIGRGVKDIAPGAFRGCVNLEKIELPESLRDYVWTVDKVPKTGYFYRRDQGLTDIFKDAIDFSNNLEFIFYWGIYLWEII